jgi:hypothetical protein
MLFACTRSMVVTKTCPPLKIRFITAYGNSPRERTLDIALFLRFSLQLKGWFRVARCIVISIEALGFTLKYPLSR